MCDENDYPCVHNIYVRYKSYNSLLFSIIRVLVFEHISCSSIRYVPPSVVYHNLLGDCYQYRKPRILLISIFLIYLRSIIKYDFISDRTTCVRSTSRHHVMNDFFIFVRNKYFCFRRKI